MKRTLLVMLLLFGLKLAAHTNDCKSIEYELKSVYYELKAKVERNEITIEQAQKIYKRKAEKLRKGGC